MVALLLLALKIVAERLNAAIAITYYAYPSLALPDQSLYLSNNNNNKKVTPFYEH